MLIIDYEKRKVEYHMEIISRVNSKHVIVLYLCQLVEAKHVRNYELVFKEAYVKSEQYCLIHYVGAIFCPVPNKPQNQPRLGLQHMHAFIALQIISDLIQYRQQSGNIKQTG